MEGAVTRLKVGDRVERTPVLEGDTIGVVGTVTEVYEMVSGGNLERWVHATGDDGSVWDYPEGQLKFLPSGDTRTMTGGTHYLRDIQPFDIIKCWSLGYWRGNVLKYILRCREKNKVEDLKKARDYLDFLITNYDDLDTKGIL